MDDVQNVGCFVVWQVGAKNEDDGKCLIKIINSNLMVVYFLFPTSPTKCDNQGPRTILYSCMCGFCFSENYIDA